MRRLIRSIARFVGFNPVAWFSDTRRMHELVAAFDLKPPLPRQEAPQFAVVVAPWLGTAVPWFSLVCGLFLASGGSKVTFILDDLPFGGHGLRFRFVRACIRSVLRMLEGQYDVIYLSKITPADPPSAPPDELIGRLARLNAVWALRGEMSAPGRQQHMDRSVRQLRNSYSAIACVLRQRYDVLFVPGGVWGSSGIWAERARAAGMRVASFDSGGYGTLMLGVDGIACQLQDIPRAYALLKRHATSPSEHAYIIESALSEIQSRRSGVDKFASQMQGTTSADPRFAGAVLIALNSSWDSAALGLHAVFDNSADWIVATVRHLLDNTPATVVVRQHPAERLEFARTSDDYRGLLARHFGTHERLHFIAADEPINSYDLLEQVAAVVVYTSTLGIEAAAHGKPVITPSHCYYSDLGFVHKAVDLAQYQQHLTDAASGDCVVTSTMRNDALSCFYLTQCCNWVFSPFNPEGFSEWSCIELAKLSQHEKVRATLHALRENIPIAYLNHVARFALEAGKT